MSTQDVGTPGSPMTECPKCGFQQPTDPYCAKCGVDMTKLPKKSASFLSRISKQPALFGLIAAVTIIVTIGVMRVLRPAPTQEVSNSNELAVRIAEMRDRRRLSGKASESIQKNLEAQVSENNPGDDFENGTNADTSAHDSTASSIAAHATNTAEDSRTGKKVDAAKKEASLLVAFAWAEVSREWLQAMGATDPGMHRVPDLEARLRESAGAYRILEVTRHRLGEKPEPIQMSRGGRFAVRFDVIGATDAALNGSLQTTIRGADGAVRAPAAAAVSIEKGQGSIVTLSPSNPNSTGAEIVVLILPRWGADRNP